MSQVAKQPVIPAKPFIIVDGSSYLFRAYHALPPLTTSTGLPAGAIYGVVNMLRKLLVQYKPQQAVVVFDSKEKTFRHEIFAAYKANRTAMPEDLAPQIAPLQQVIVAMGLPLLVMPGVEADDIIGTLAVQANAAGMFVLISTGDKDMAQLVNANTVLINTMSGNITDTAGVKEKFQVLPEQIVDYLSLIGDQVDNIPGVPKVGPKTAAKWLEQYHSLQEIIANVTHITGKVGENLRATLPQLPLYKQLVTIDTNVALACNLGDLWIKDQDAEALRGLFTTLEFKSWLRDLDATQSEREIHKKVVPTESEVNAMDGNLTERTRGAIGQAAVSAAHIASEKLIGAQLTPVSKFLPSSAATADYKVILTQVELTEVLTELQLAPVFAFDTETTSINYMLAELVGIALCWGRQSVYIPLAHDYLGAPAQLNREAVLQQLQPILNCKDKIIVGHNLKYDLGVLANYGIKVQANLYDTMLASYVLSSSGGKHDLDSLAKAIFDHTNIAYEDVAGKGAKQISFNQVMLESAAPYAAEDAAITLQLYQYFSQKLADLPTLQQVFSKIEMPLMPVIAAMEQHGVKVDVIALKQQSHELAHKIAIIEAEIFDNAGEKFNINSPKQLQEVLFVKLGLPILEKTPTGQPSTAENVLEELSAEYALPKMVLEYRSLSKLKSTYTDSLPEQINQRTGRIHTSYHQAVTATGRLSSSAPNLQNIPVKTNDGKKIRAAFVSLPGYKIVTADYSQIELRIMAHLSGDPGLLAAFRGKQDIHRATAAEVFGVDLAAVTVDQRRNAKAINFGLIYGMSAFGLAKQLDITRDEADAYIKNYFTKFPAVQNFMQQTRELAAQQGFVETLFGRRLYLPDIKSKNMGLRKAAERAAINAPMQGGQADIIKIAMINIARWLQDSKTDAYMIMQVHDELIFEVAAAQVEVVVAKVTELMMHAANLDVDLEVGIGVGDNWEQAKSLA